MTSFLLSGKILDCLDAQSNVNYIRHSFYTLTAHVSVEELLRCQSMKVTI